MRQTVDHRERAYAPRGLRREAAADWVGMSPTKFDELLKAGLMPLTPASGWARLAGVR